MSPLRRGPKRSQVAPAYTTGARRLPANLDDSELPYMIVSDALQSGTLVALLPNWSPKSGIMHAVFPSSRGLLPSVRALIDYLAQRLVEEAP